MKLKLGLTLILVSTALCSADEPAVELSRLESTLASKQTELRERQVSPDQYRDFTVSFRAELNSALRRVPQNPTNNGLYARILSRLGDSEQALESLKQPLARNPGNPALLLAKGHIQFEQNDFRGALAAANAVLSRDPTNADALSLKFSSAGRGSKQQISSTVPAANNPARAAVAARNISNIVEEARSAPRAKALPTRGASSTIEQLHSMGDSDAAPEPTMWDRIQSFLTTDEALVKEDIAVLHRKAQEFIIPPEASSLGTTNSGALAEFGAWLKTVKREDMPPIDYGILGSGQFGGYQLSALSKGTLNLNHFIRGAEPEARTAVLMHELYHYWDKKVAANHYENVSYGKIGEGHMPEHEYNAYQLTALYWRQFKPENARSPLAMSLSRLPTDPDEVQKLVDGIEAKRNRQ